MIPICSFESNAADIMRIWDAGIALYDHVSEQETVALCTHPLDLPMYTTATLLMTSNAEDVKCRIGELLSSCVKSEVPDVGLLCTLPLAMEEYLAYTADTETVIAWIPITEELLNKIKEIGFDSACTEALHIGAEAVLLRLRSECKLPMARVAHGQRIADFHTRHYSSASQLYFEKKEEDSLLLTTIVTAFGFVEDDAFPKVRAYLLEHAFDLSRVWYGFLFYALHNLEVEHAFFASIIEGGAAPSNASAAYLSGIVALLRYGVGIDLKLLGRGIECAEPTIPSYIQYKLLIPVGKRYVCFEGEGVL